jgi:hypothetical protein
MCLIFDHHSLLLYIVCCYDCFSFFHLIFEALG